MPSEEEQPQPEENVVEEKEQSIEIQEMTPRD